MSEYPHSVEPGGGRTSATVATQQATPDSSGMRSPRGFLGSLVLVLALPVAVLIQVLLGSGSSLTMHVALAVGCALLAISVTDFGTPGWVTWMGRVAAGAFSAIFFLQAASELMRIDSFSHFALQVLGNWPERVLTTLFVLWLVGLLLSASRDRTRILGFVVMAVVVGVNAYNYVLLYLDQPPGLTAVYLLPFVWLLLESSKRQPTKAS